MDPDKGFLDVSEEKKIYDFLLVREKSSSMFSHWRKKRGEREKRVDFNKNRYLFGKYSLHLVSRLFSGKIGRRFNRVDRVA